MLKCDDGEFSTLQMMGEARGVAFLVGFRGGDACFSPTKDLPLIFVEATTATSASTSVTALCTDADHA